MEMVELIAPVDRELIESELNSYTFIRNTNKGNNKIYIINSENAPHTLREIGRLRELTFRAAGGGTGLELDLDEFDTGKHSYDQLIVYNHEVGKIIGGYRFICCRKAIHDDATHAELSTAHYFRFSPQFIREYLPYTIELGRSWVQPEFQPTVNPRMGLYALDNIWDGLGALIVLNPDIKYFFGKITMYSSYNAEARDLLLYFLHRYFPDRENLLQPYYPLNINTPESKLETIFQQLPYKDAFKILNSRIRSLGENIPPLINIYMNLSPTMKTFGTAVNPDFGGVEETGIMVKIADIYPEKKERHILTFKDKN